MDQHATASSKMTATKSAQSGPNSHASKGQRGPKSVTNFSIESIIGEHLMSDLHTNESAARLTSTTKQDLHHFQPDNQRDQRDKQLHMVATGQQRVLKKKIRPKNFHCPVCPMAFSNNGQLKNHVRIHTGERPFKCNYDHCGKTFTRNEELTRHKLIHSGHRPHECASCGKQFGRKDHLKKHVKTHEKAKRSRAISGKIVRSSFPNGDSLQFKYRTIKKSNQSGRTGGQQSHLMIAAQPFGAQLGGKRTSQQGNTMSAPNNCPNLAQPNFTPFPINAQPMHQFNQTTGPLIAPISQLNTSGFQFSSNMAPPAPLSSGLIGPMEHQLGHFASAATAIQKFATDYWQNWYNFVGHQHQQQASANSIFCMTSSANAAACSPPEKRLERIVRKI